MSEKIPIGSSHFLTASPYLGKETAHLMVYAANAPPRSGYPAPAPQSVPAYVERRHEGRSCSSLSLLF